MIETSTKERTTHEPKSDTPKKGTVEPSSQKAVDQTRLDHDTIADLFQDRDQPPVAESPSPRALEAEKLSLPQDGQGPRRADDSKTPDNNKDDNKDNNKDDNKRQDTSPEIQTLKEELEKTHKRLTENQQYGRQNAQRLKNALKITRELVEEGSLSDEEAAKLQDSLQSDAEEDDSSSPSPSHSHSHSHLHPFGKVLAAANKELEFIRKYTDDERLDDKVGAFDYFLLVAPTEEREQALEDLTDLLDTPLKLAKKMLSIGQGYEKSYREMKAAGGIQGMITKKDQDIDNLHKSIDKLTKKLAQYEDYDKPRYRLDESVGEPGESEEEASAKDTITSLFSHRDRGDQR